MQYSIGDIFIDIRGDQKRTFLITDAYIDGLEPINYELHIMPDEKDDVWSHYMLKTYVDRGYLVYYPVVK
jgi:hypothetical protein